MNYTHDLISIGDATIDTFLMMFDHDIEIVDYEGQRKALISWGDKLPVGKMYRSVAGNAANNAVGSSRLGLKTAFYSVMAHDAGGREIMHKMQKEGVAIAYIVIDDQHGTNASTVVSFKGERTIFVYHEHRTYVLPDFAPSRWVYLTSMGQGFETIYKDLADYIDRYKVGLGFNPGTFQLRKGVKANAEMLKRTTLLSLNKQEAQLWVGKNIEDHEELCKRLFKLGPKAVALTDGRKGAFSYSEEGFYYVPEYPGKRIEATGAGDSFTTAYMAALMHGKTHAEALAWGPVNAASVVFSIGPQEGLLTREELERRIGTKPGYKAVLISNDKIKQRVMKMVEKKKE